MQKCKSEPVFTLISGEKFCKYCFSHYFEKKVRKTMRQYELIEKGDRIAVALSGGKDSSVLLSILAGIWKERKDFDLFAILVDEGIKGYSTLTQKFAQNLCKKLGVKALHYFFQEGIGIYS